MFKSILIAMILLFCWGICQSDCNLYIPSNMENSLVTLEDHVIDNLYKPHGTGFMFNYEKTDSIFIVTNRHIFVNRDSLFVRVNVLGDSGKIYGQRWVAKLKDENNDALWTAHPDDNIDLAVVAYRNPYRIYPIPSERIKPLGEVKLSDPVLFLGFPLLEAAIGDINYPLVRSGAVSFKTRKDTGNPLMNRIAPPYHIIIDGAIMSGNSGSPVLSCPVKGSSKITLIGVISSHIFQITKVDLSDTLISGKYQKDYNLGICIPAERIAETVEEYYKNRTEGAGK